jgi:hypothetical protein
LKEQAAVAPFNRASWKFLLMHWSNWRTIRTAAAKWGGRPVGWAIEQGYQQLKEELGLDHFEGRSWRGLHHHLTLCFLAFCFLTGLRMSKKTPLVA